MLARLYLMVRVLRDWSPLYRQRVVLLNDKELKYEYIYIYIRSKK